MTLTDLMPIRIAWWDRERPARKHRALDEVERLQRQLHGARLLIAGLHLQLDDKDRAHEATVRRIDDRYTATIRDLEARLAELHQRLDVSVLAEAAAAQTQEIDTREIRQRFEHGSPVRLGASPHAVTNPGHTPSWAQPDADTRPVPAATA